MVSHAVRALLARQERERRQIEVVGERVAARIAPEINVAILDAFAAGRDIVPVVTEQLERKFAPLLLKAMVAAHLVGKLRSARQAAVTLRKRRTMGAYGDALAYLKKRVALTDEQMTALIELYGNESVKVTRGLADQTEAAVQRAMRKIVEKGMHVRDGIAELRQELVRSGQGPLSDGLMQTFVRTQTGMAYSAGRWNGNQSEAIQEILWGYEYVTAGDGRVRPTHQAMDGVRAAKDDPLWQTWWPPAGFNCRCSTLEIFAGEREASDLRPPPAVFTADDGTVVTDPQPDPGWAFNPGAVFRDVLGG